MPTVMERCREIAAREPQPAAPVQAASALAFDAQVQYIDINSDLATGALLIATLDGRLVASVALRLRDRGGFVHSLYVAPECRGRGVGEELVRLAADVAAEHGKPTLGLNVNDGNESAQRLYERLGFRPYTQASATSTTWVAVLPLADAR